VNETQRVLRELAQLIFQGQIKVIDLTAPLHRHTPIIQLPPPFANTPGFTLHLISEYDEKGPAWYWNWFETGEHVGTHFDAPIHWITGKDLPENSVDTIPAHLFVGPACVIDVTAEVRNDPDYLMTVKRILRWEDVHGKIPPRSWVLMRTGWSAYIDDPERYFNVGPDGMPHTPGWSKESAEFLARERDVLGVGVETVGTDAGKAATFDPPFPNHNIMHGYGKFGLTSLMNLDQLPPTGSVVVAAPLKIVRGSGSPVRVIALVP
jgi:kynurenine formamidase